MAGIPLCACCKTRKLPCPEDAGASKDSQLDPLCEHVGKLLLACDKLGRLLQAITCCPETIQPPPVATRGAGRTFTRSVRPAADRPGPGVVDRAVCHLEWLLPVAEPKVWTLKFSDAYRAAQLKRSIAAGFACPGLFVVLVEDGLTIAQDVTDAGFRDQVDEEKGERFLLPRVLPVNCRTVQALDLGREARLLAPRLVAASVVNDVLGDSGEGLPPASLVSEIKTDDPALLWEVMDARIGSILHLPPSKFRKIVACHGSR